MSSTLKYLIADHDAKPPVRAHEHDAGIDLCALVSWDIYPGERVMVETGLKMAIPAGHVGMVCPRSGLALNHGITVLNAPGIIDAGYRGPVNVILLNTNAPGGEVPALPFSVRYGDRIAQLVIVPFAGMLLEEVAQLPDSLDTRGEGGLGSTGQGA